MPERLSWAAVFIVLLFAPRVIAADASILKPPPGAKVAIVVFEDLQCADGARIDPLVAQAASAYHVAIVRLAFTLPMHSWAFDAAIWARFFDAKSEKLGHDFRDAIYANQNRITFSNLMSFVKKFDDANKVAIPAANDPDGKLAAGVKADFALGQQIGLVHAPTIFIVGQRSVSAPLVETATRDELNQRIEDMLKKSAAAVPARRAANRGAR